MRDPNGDSQGFGFVCYRSAESAQSAISAMNNSHFGTQKLYVQLAQAKNQRSADLALERKNRVLYVNGLHWSVNDSMLGQIFQPYGNIISATV